MCTGVGSSVYRGSPSLYMRSPKSVQGKPWVCMGGAPNVNRGSLDCGLTGFGNCAPCLRGLTKHDSVEAPHANQEGPDWTGQIV